MVTGDPSIRSVQVSVAISAERACLADDHIKCIGIEYVVQFGGDGLGHGRAIQSPLLSVPFGSCPSLRNRRPPATPGSPAVAFRSRKTREYLIRGMPRVTIHRGRGKCRLPIAACGTVEPLSERRHKATVVPWLQVHLLPRDLVLRKHGHVPNLDNRRDSPKNLPPVCQ